MSNTASEDEWLVIDNFSPGCYNKTNVAYNSLNRLLGSPKGAADAEETWGCASIPSGALAALPGIVEAFTWPAALALNTLGPNYLVGLLVHNNLLNGTTEAFSVVEWDDGTNHHQGAISFITDTGVGTSIIATSEATGTEFYGCPYPQFTRATATDPTTTPGLPVIVWPSGGDAQPSHGIPGAIYMYPDPSAPTTYGALNLVSGSTGGAGQILVHQSRIIALVGTGYSWPAGGGYNTNEQVCFTDPGNSVIYGDQNEVFAPEEPFGYGCGGSQSAGELFLVKHSGGALIATGDIANPNITILPGVQGTGGFYGNGSSGPSGYFYCSNDNGAWVWNGGNVSQKISNQLDDQFFLDPSYYTLASTNYGFYTQSVGDKVYFSGNWMYDTRAQAWWRYLPSSAQGGMDYYWIQSFDGRNIFIAPLSFPTSTRVFLWRQSKETPTQSYQWQSLPLKIEPANRRVDVREIVVRVSCATAGTSISVELFDQGTSVWGSFAMTGTIGPGVEMIRFNVYGQGVSEPQVRVAASGTGSGDMPVIDSISLRYNTRAHQAVTD